MADLGALAAKAAEERKKKAEAEGKKKPTRGDQAAAVAAPPSPSPSPETIPNEAVLGPGASREERIEYNKMKAKERAAARGRQ